MRAMLAASLVLFLGGCETLEFYRQAVTGQISILARREAIPKLIAAPATPAPLRQRLETVQRILQFAHSRLALEPAGRYASYVDVHADYVVWNVFAADEFSTHPMQWCYPVIGCAAYRGYFDQADAKRYATRLAARRRDTAVGGVAAYSTLGWFADPVLSTFVNWPEPELAGLFFHELAHARVFVRGDTSFNEAFASFVERRGVYEWLGAFADAAQQEQAVIHWQQSDRFVAFLLAWRDELQHLYDQPYNDDALRLLKFDEFAALERCYRANRERFGDQDWFFKRLPNNARFVPLAAYNELIAGFESVFREVNGDWPTFYRRVGELGREPEDKRTAELKQRGAALRANAAAESPIQCEALGS